MSTFDIGPGQDEEPPASGARRLRVDLLVGAGLLIVVVLLGKAVSGGERTDARPGVSTPALTPTPPPRTPDVASPSSVIFTRDNGEIQIARALPRRVSDNRTLCPEHIDCSYEAAVPGTVLEAVRAVFPRVEVRAVHSVRLMGDPWFGTLWFRQLNLEVGDADLFVRISAPGPEDDLASGTQPAGGLFYASTLHQYTVFAEAGPGAGGTLDKLRRLTHDERLLYT